MRVCIFLLCLVWGQLCAAHSSRGIEVDVISHWGGESTLTVTLSDAVPYRVSVVNNPNQIIIHFQGTDFEGVLHSNVSDNLIDDISISTTSSLIIGLSDPALPSDIVLSSQQDTARFSMRLQPASQDDFDQAAVARAPSQPDQPISIIQRRNTGDRPWVIALDPGHGGQDPGAIADAYTEADLMLLFARELRDSLRLEGFDVALTRSDDVYVGLDGRMTVARENGADVFLSLHADVVMAGEAHGITVYTLPDGVKDQADTKITQRHHRDDMITGSDLSGQDDEVAKILLDMVRRETAPKSQSLAQSIVWGVQTAGAAVNSNPLRSSDFAVLRSADIPSVLIELGFLSSEIDLARLKDPNGRAILISGLVNGLLAWTAVHAQDAARLRQ